MRPAELAAGPSRAGLQPVDFLDMRYRPLLHRASWCRETLVNYLAAFARAADTAQRR